MDRSSANRAFGARRGVALVTALIFAMLAAFMFAVGVQFTQSSLRQGRNTKADAQVYNVALAGITHATNWLQRQNIQPVTVFDPKANTNAPDDDPETPPTEEQLGLVNEFTVDPRSNLWGRYEVGRSASAPARAPLTQIGSHSALYGTPPTWTAEDISLQRGAAAGTVWRVRSKGYLFDRTNPATPFSLTNPPPKQQITLDAEIRRSAFHYHPAALYDYKTNAAVDLHAHDALSNTVVQSADGSGYVFWTNTNNVDLTQQLGFSLAGPTIKNANDPTQPNYVSPTLTDQLMYHFGVPDLATLKGMADEYYEDPNDIPQPMNAMKLVYIKPNGGHITFDNNPTLNGSGILVVEGDLTVDGSTIPQTWNGLIFVTGDYEQKKTSTITGGLVCGGDARVHGYDTGPAHPAKLYYSPSTLDTVNAKLGTYRMMRSTIKAVNDATARTY
jgi:Tfp pilus assembly protein PilX